MQYTHTLSFLLPTQFEFVWYYLKMSLDSQVTVELSCIMPQGLNLNLTRISEDHSLRTWRPKPIRQFQVVTSKHSSI